MASGSVGVIYERCAQLNPDTDHMIHHDCGYRVDIHVATDNHSTQVGQWNENYYNKKDLVK